MPTILVLHGPNMALKGVAAVDESLEARASELSVELSVVQSNTEGVLLDRLLEQREEIDGVIVNPGVLAPAAWALAEALTLLKKPAVEVLLEPSTRGASALTGIVMHQVHGQGPNGYVLALEHLVKALPATEPTEEGTADEPPPTIRGKTIGRKKPAATEEPTERSEKTIGRRAPASEAPAKVAAAGLTREAVRKRLSARLAGTLKSDELASWARTEWSALQKGGPCEEGQRERLDSVLLTLMAAARASEHVLLAQLAKLEGGAR